MVEGEDDCWRPGEGVRDASSEEAAVELQMPAPLVVEVEEEPQAQRESRFHAGEAEGGLVHGWVSGEELWRRRRGEERQTCGRRSSAGRAASWPAEEAVVVQGWGPQQLVSEALDARTCRHRPMAEER